MSRRDVSTTPAALLLHRPDRGHATTTAAAFDVVLDHSGDD